MDQMEVTTLGEILTTLSEKPARKTPYQYKIAAVLFKYYAPVQLTIALFGNLMILLVFSRKSMRDGVTSLLFRLLAISDTFMVLVTLVPEAILENGGSSVPYSSDARCKAQGYLYFAGKSYAVWVLVLIVLERFIGVNFPHKASFLITKKRAQIASFILLVVIYSLYGFIPIVMKASVVKDAEGNILNYFCGIPRDTNIAFFMNKVWPAYDLCIYSLVPFLLILGANISILWRLAQASRLRSRATTGAEASDVSGMTAMLLGISFGFIVCTLPNNISFFERQKNKLGSPDSYLFWAISVLLTNMNHCINFYIYCLTGTKFRKEILAMFRLGGYHQRPPIKRASNTKSKDALESA